MVTDKEILEFAHELFSQIPNVADIRKTAVGLFDRDDTVVAFRIFLLALFAFNGANYSATQQAAHSSGFVHQNKDADRVPILGPSRWNGAEVVGESHAILQDFR